MKSGLLFFGDGSDYIRVNVSVVKQCTPRRQIARRFGAMFRYRFKIQRAVRKTARKTQGAVQTTANDVQKGCPKKEIDFFIQEFILIDRETLPLAALPLDW